MPRKKKTPDTLLGSRLMKIRLDNNLSLEKMGELLGRDRTTIWRYEMEGNVDAETILAYCKEFGVDPNYLLGWETDSEKAGPSEEEFLKLLAKHGKHLWVEMNQ